jgi:hypothetical protein
MTESKEKYGEIWKFGYLFIHEIQHIVCMHHPASQGRLVIFAPWPGLSPRVDKIMALKCNICHIIFIAFQNALKVH